ncbi:hypothetical protein [Ruminococcus albus]|uniref:Uncharacterized protein n=1 Tax=Ruminococcus albus TaxID=1264 RepID=A0A1I1DR78_RUMAL|nr:hypothetical protein [Ruminococcus albus]SFB76926.1 hypothetical protein SAMN02910406_00467 [Ruminococcus albus]
MKEFRLQPLRLCAGWTVAYNNFSEYDPACDGEEYSYELCEDLLQLVNGDLLIDLGWYPHGDVNGCYKMYLVDMNREATFERPLEVFSSKSKGEILDKLEYWTQPGFYAKYKVKYPK